MTRTDDFALFLIQKKKRDSALLSFSFKPKSLKGLETSVPQAISAVSVLDISQKVLEISQSWF